MQSTMATRQLTNFRIDRDLLEALRTIRDRDGVPLSVQVRFAIRDWVQSRGVPVKAERLRAQTRKRP
jgi:antitoxin component of RelBE/YafQ-DinJ toxin-antitoxin module